jgi:hypothetical protein
MTIVNVTPVVPTPIGVSRAGPAGKGWVFANGAPTDDLGRIGELYLDTETFDVYGPKTSVWPPDPFASLKVADSVAWVDVTGKPATFPPSTHAHVIADITGLVTALANKAPLVHTQALSTITDAGTAAARDVGTDPGDLPELDGSGKLPVSLLPDAILGALSYQSAWNATTNSPTIPAAAAGNKGWYYVVTTAGSTSVDGITDWKVGDWLVSNGAAWDKIDSTDEVTDVAGLVGSINASELRTALALVVGTDVQAFDSDLAAIAALTTTAYGRALLALADAAALRTVAGLVIGTDVQAYDSDLAAIAALSTTSFGRSVLTQADATALRSQAGLVIGTNIQAYDSDLAAIATLTTTSFGRGLLALADAAALRTAAGLGTAALATTGVSSGNVPVLDGAGKLVTSVLPDAIVGAMNYQGTWNATTNSPAIPAAAASNKGWFYIVATAGTTSIGGVTDWQIGDWVVSSGTSWSKIDSSDQVNSVAGLQGTITAAALKAALAITLADITDASPNGRSLMAMTYSAMRTALGLVPGVAAGNVVVLDGSAKLPAVDASQLTNLPGGGAWTQIGSTVTIAAPTANVVFTGLGSYKDIAIEYAAAQHNNGSNTPTVALTLSSDGGGSYGSAIFLLGSIASSSQVWGKVLMLSRDMEYMTLLNNCATTSTDRAPMAAQTSTSTSIAVKAATRVDALRLAPGAGSFVSGTFKVYGR